MRRKFKPARAKRLSGASKHVQIAEGLREQMESGVLPPGTRLPPDSELHRVFKVAKPTLVRALNDLAKEGRLVRRRGAGTYVARRPAPSILPAKILRLGIAWHGSVTPDQMLHSFQGAMTRAALAAWGLGDASPEYPPAGYRQATRAVWSARDRGVTVECVGESSFSRARRPPLEVFAERRFDGLLLMSIIEEEWIERVLDLRVPAVVVDYPNEWLARRADQVYVDPTSGYRQAVRHLVSRGMKRIHFVGSRLPVPAPTEEMSPAEWHAYRGEEDRTRIEPDSVLRLATFRQAMFECGLEVPADRVHAAHPDSKAFRLLAERLASMAEAERPEGVVCHAIEQAGVLMEVFADRGLRLHAAGATDRPHGGPALPILADGRAMGVTAAEILAGRLQHPDRRFLRVGVLMDFDETEPSRKSTEGDLSCARVRDSEGSSSS